MSVSQSIYVNAHTMSSRRFFELLAALIARQAGAAELEELCSNHAHLLQKHRLEGMIGSYAQHASDPQIRNHRLPGWVYKKHLTTSRYNLIQMDEVEAIFGQETGLQAVLIGGLSLIEKVYQQDYGARSVSDIDMVVSERDTPVLLNILRARGYAPREFGDPFTPEFPGHLEWSRRDGHNLYNADIKHKIKTPISLAYEFYKYRSQELIDGSFTCANGIKIPSPTHMVILAVMGLEHKSYSKLRGFIDLAMITHSPLKDQIDWEHIHACMHEMQVPFLASQVLGFCKKHLAAEVPANIIAGLTTRRSAWSKAWFSFFMNPETLAKGTTGIHRKGKGVPTLDTMQIEVVRRITNYDHFGYGKRMVRTIYDGFETYNCAFYKRKTNRGKRLFKILVHPLFVLSSSFFGVLCLVIKGSYMAAHGK